VIHTEETVYVGPSQSEPVRILVCSAVGISSTIPSETASGLKVPKHAYKIIQIIKVIIVVICTK
jgi:hypothetical protein